MAPSLIPAILAGGKGERFWPLSRKMRPKQFLCLDGSGRSLLQGTADRLLFLAQDWENLWIVTSSLVADGVREQLPDLPETSLLVEPEGKDTAPAVAWATIEIAKKYGSDAVIGFFPADHWIGDLDAYYRTLEAATLLARQEEAIVTLGIQPEQPATGYGYIEQGEMQGNYGNLPIYKVLRFTEKPDRPTAEAFLQAGKFSWNSGMFIFRAGVVLDELQRHAPQMIDALRAKGRDAYADLEKISIDYALMEKTQLAYVLPANFGWDDLGDWNALERLLPEQSGNVAVGNHVSLDTAGAIVYSSAADETIVTIGLEDVVIVRDRNATLVVAKDRTQDIKSVLKKLKSLPNSEELL
jgi:mannose-1-phosphate guanylyltransferase